MIDADARTAIDSALAASDIRTAANVAEAAIAAGQKDPMLYNLAAWSREEAGDFAGAHRLLDNALAMSPGDALIIAAKGAALRREDRLDEALRTLDQALRIKPDLAVAWLERGFAFDAGGSFRMADESYRRAAHFDPNLAEAFSGIASIALRDGNAQLVRDCCARALALDPREPAANLIVIAMDVEEGRTQAAVPALHAILERADLEPAKRIGALTLLGDVLAREDDPAGAFAAYEQAQALYEKIHAPRFGPESGRQSYIDVIRRIDDRMAQVDPDEWVLPAPNVVAGEAAGHVFLLGFPRSGTTLLENVLASAPDVVALEERPTLAASDRAFLSSPDGFDDLEALDTTSAQPFREAYWAKVAACGADVKDRLFVDMDPLKGAYLPVITRMFPHARIVVMRRDPRDVVWSCFRRSFRVSPATYQFTSLERVAHLYDALMRLIDRCVERLRIHIHEVRYSDLVSDFDTVTQRLCDFADIEWTPAMRNFSDTARKRGVGTASVMQVRKGLFDGSGQWKPFEEQMKPVLPILEPWVNKFGFAA